MIGGGKVGCATARALKSAGIPMNLLERNASLRERLSDVTDKVFLATPSIEKR